MTLYEFIGLDLNSRASFLWEKGCFIDSFADNKIRINLYHVSNLYVKVFLDYSTSEIIDMTPFKEGQRLEIYIYPKLILK